MNLYNISDQIVFKILRDIDQGYLEIIKCNGELLKFGNPNSSLKSILKIKKPSFLDSQYNYGNNAHDCVYVGIGCFIRNDT